MKMRIAGQMKRRQSEERNRKSHQMNQKLKTMKMMRTRDRTIRPVVVRRKMKTRPRRSRSSVPLN
jgi:hypothetical protein